MTDPEEARMSPAPPHAPQTGEIALAAAREPGGRSATGIAVAGTRQLAAQRGEGRR